MHNAYKDITSKLGTPQWYDENATPRYCDFSPDQVADIYANQVALLLIACQACGKQFKVAISTSIVASIGKDIGVTSLLDRYTIYGAECAFSYGDPPNAGCCGAGATMSSDTIAVLEFYDRQWTDWYRHPELEGTIVDGKLYKKE